MVLVESVPGLVSGPEGGLEERVGHGHRGARGDVEGSHGEQVCFVGCGAAPRGGHGLADGGVHVGALGGGDVDAHAGAAERESAFELSFGDLRAERKADAVVHGGTLGVGRQVGDGPAALLEVGFDGFLEGVPSEVGTDDDVLVFNCPHGSVLSGVCAGR